MAVSEEIQRKMLEGASSVTPNYEVDYNDNRFGKIESDKSQALTELEQTYGGMINSSDKFYNDQIQATQVWSDIQRQNQQNNTDFAIEQIEQQKDKAYKDYLKEQSGAYVDWQKQSSKHGTEAEKIADSGLWGTGYSESSQVSMYNTYQNRVATARESYNNAVLNYDNAIKDAMLQNNAALAEIAFTALQQQLELSLQGFQYKNQLIIDQANKKTELDNMYYNRYLDVLDQINKENSMAEEVRQYNKSMAEEIRQYNESMAWKTEQAELDRAFEAQEAEIQRKYQAAEAELDRKHEKEILAAKNQYEKERITQQHENDLAKLEKQKEYDLEVLAQKLQNEKDLLDYQNSLTSTDTLGTIPKDEEQKPKEQLKKITETGGGGGKFGPPTPIMPKPTTTAAHIAGITPNQPLNMKSVDDLGLGMVSAEKLASLVNSGQVITYTKNGETYVAWNPLNYKSKYTFKK